MKIYSLTRIGYSIASNPSNNHSLAMKILYVLRRRGGQGSDEWLKDQLGTDGNQLGQALKVLEENNAVKVVGG